MAITYHGSASSPTDNGTSTATTVSVTPPASMTTGDLVLIFAYQRGTTTTFSVSASGGQSWSTPLTHNGAAATLSTSFIWCRYNGTWSTDPSVLFSAGTNTNVVMHVFRPSDTSKLWAVDVTNSPSATNKWLDYTAGAPVNGLTSSWTPLNNSNVSITFWGSDDDNSWGTLSGTGWVVTGSAQYRNTSGNDTSSSYAHLIQTTAASVPIVQKTQTVNGNDPGIKGGFVFYEYDPPVFSPNMMLMFM
jgi:hypothetical protein